MTQSAFKLGLVGLLALTLCVPLQSSGDTATWRTEMPRSADSFVDSIGVNTHLHYGGDSAYNARFAAFAPLLEATGIRHLRDGLIDTTYQPYYDHLNELGRAGIHATLITSLGQSAALLRTYPSRVPDSFEAYEGPNEYDKRGDPNWVAQLTAFTRLLYSTVKGDPSTARFPVIAPSLTSAQAAQAFGNTSEWFDYCNLHNYFAGFNPGTPGWGSAAFGSRYGSIAYNIGVEKQVSAAKPIITTETGYCTLADAKNAVPAVVQGRYVPRMFFEQFNAGIVRTFEYEFADEGADFYDTCGLVSFNLKPKAAYHALSAVIHALSDRGPNFKTSPLRYSMFGEIANVDHTLLEKRDGTYYLALWIELPSWDGNALKSIAVAPQLVKLALPDDNAHGTISNLDDQGVMSSIPFSVRNHALSLKVTDRVEIVALTLPSTVGHP
jgi:hypothetical protein